MSRAEQLGVGGGVKLMDGSFSVIHARDHKSVQ